MVFIFVIFSENDQVTYFEFHQAEDYSWFNMTYILIFAALSDAWSLTGDFTLLVHSHVYIIELYLSEMMIHVVI